jgi:putative Holliday junction resolvase
VLARTLGLDVGSRTIGVAISDPLGLFAQPVETLRRVGRRADAAAIAQLARSREAGSVVIGLPLRTDGSEGDSAKEARGFAAALAEVAPELVIAWVDERFTTAQAERSLIAAGARRSARKAVIDQAAAVLILQSHLDGHCSLAAAEGSGSPL